MTSTVFHPYTVRCAALLVRQGWRNLVSASHVLVSLPYHQFTLDISVRRFGLAAFRPLETCCGLDVDNHTNWRSICLRCSGSLMGNHLHRLPAFRYFLSSSFIKTTVNGTAFMLVYLSRNSGLSNIDYRWRECSAVAGPNAESLVAVSISNHCHHSILHIALKLSIS